VKRKPKDLGLIRTRWARQADLERMAALDGYRRAHPDQLDRWAHDGESILVVAESADPAYPTTELAGWFRTSRPGIMAALVLNPAGLVQYSPGDVLAFLLNHFVGHTRQNRLDRMAILVDAWQDVENHALQTLPREAFRLQQLDAGSGSAVNSYGARLLPGGPWRGEYYFVGESLPAWAGS
jgi:hypothetical protein